MSKIVASVFLFLLEAPAFVNAVGQVPMLSRNSGFNPAETIDWRLRFEILGVRSFLGPPAEAGCGCPHQMFKWI
ncbi:hypothetical protein [Bradyrhizobium sp. CCBAU 11361]|uniref:hypothetical protein n=1 Tax=Bradyrhizobium sp. CCBAU 11361 TaxID=1630812 RepID=UPI002303FCAB|nr:hypothetical protein [Bradyrhizobium sp. CCBAU 11361]